MKFRLMAAMLAIFGIGYGLRFTVHAQEASPASPVAPRAQAGGRTQRPPAYPDRPKAPEEVLARGKALYGVSCAFCHGSDAGGGEVGPNLLRSGVVLQDQSGELIQPIVHGARVDKGMPRIDLTDAQITDIAAWLHSLKVASRTDADESINIVTGTASDGEVDFKNMCGSCHSTTGDLQGFASKMPNAKTLQQTWMLPGGAGGRGGFGPPPPSGLHVPPVTVTVTQASGEKAEGALVRIDDFYVGLREKDGTVKGYMRNGDVPKVEIHDPLAAHRALLEKYSDKEIHDITAYLVTLK